MNLFSISIDTISREALLGRIAESAAQRKPFRIATVNPEFLVRARRDTAFAESLFAADVRVRDGFGAGLLFWLRLRRAPRRITGADLVIDLLRLADKNRWTVCIANRKGGLSTFSEMQKAIQKKYPKIIVTGKEFEMRNKSNGSENPSGSKIHHLPFAGEEKEDALSFDGDVCQMLNIKSQGFSAFPCHLSPVTCHLILCSFGAPEQEFFLQRLHQQNVPAVMMGVGGALDFFTKKQLRAPRWMGAVGLEWLWRCLRQPRRIGRIATAVLVFPVLAVMDAVRMCMCLAKKYFVNRSISAPLTENHSVRRGKYSSKGVE